MTDSAPKNRLPRTGTLLLITVVLLIGGGALMVWLPYHREQTAIAEFERLGGEIHSEVIRPAWIPSAVDDEYLEVFERVTIVELADSQVSDAGLEHLQGLNNLKILSLDNTEVSDVGIEHLRGLTNLIDLLLNNTHVTEAGVEKLQKALPDCEIDWMPPAG